MALTFERKLSLTLFIVFLTLTAFAVIFFLNTLSASRSFEQQKHSHETVELVDDTVANVFEIQNGLTNFLILGNSTYLEPSVRAGEKIRADIEQLRRLTADLPAQAAQVGRMDATIKEFSAEAERKINVRKIQGSEAAAPELVWADGKRMLDEIRGAGESIKRSETDAQIAREAAEVRRFSITLWALVLSSLAGIVSLALAHFTASSEMKKRRVAQGELVAANEGLEKKVSERTSELRDTNQRLIEAAGEREAILASEQDARRQAEIATRLRDEFMATVSHELRTPLNAILGWARLMHGGTLDPEQSRKAVATIIKNSETQNKLIGDLLDVARIISGKLRLKKAPNDLANVVSEAVESVRPGASPKNVEFAFDPPSEPVFVEADHSRLVQVFTNLLGNAVKFSPEGGTISVLVEPSGDRVATTISDQGQGISPEFLPKVFERFRQDPGTERNDGGLGLGLAIVRNLVELHGGTVSASSDGLNKGAAFTVVLPSMAEPHDQGR